MFGQEEPKNKDHYYIAINDILPEQGVNTQWRGNNFGSLYSAIIVLN